MKLLRLSATFLCASLLNGACTTHATVESPPSAAPSEEILLAAPPQGWTQIGGTQSGALKLAEYVPTAELEGDSDAAHGTWTEKITVERLNGLPVPDPLEFLDGLRTDHLASCSQGTYTPIAAAEENGYPTAVAMLICPKLSVTEAGQVTMIKVIQGDEAFYTITRAMRAKPWHRPASQDAAEDKSKGDTKSGDTKSEDSNKPLPIDPALIGGASVWLRAIKVCSPATSEHPCPTPASE